MAVEYLGTGNDDGVVLGRSSTDKIAFFNGTPADQRASATLTSTASLFVMSGASYVANTSTTVSGLFGFNSTLAAQFFDALIEIRATLSELNLHKCGA
jgi:hypothetical protein